MKKISWIRRLFMSWNSLERYFQAVDNSNIISVENEKNKEIILVNEQLIQQLKKESSNLEQELQNFKNKNEFNTKILSERESSIFELKDNLSSEVAKLNEIRNERDNLRSGISEKLLPLNKIEKTFFASAGNKGKGELGELQIKVILEKSGLTPDIWTENLPVGSGNVEFAIKSGQESKWIPIDSKVLETDLDEDGKVIIDLKYQKKVLAQAREMSKYLGKKNTSKYGLLVLQSNSIYMKLYEEFPTFFQETIRNQKIYITSPSSFVQFAGTISQILEIYENVSNHDEIYRQIESVLLSVGKFVKKLDNVHKSFNIAMSTHHPTIVRKHDKLSRSLNKFHKNDNKAQIQNTDSTKVLSQDIELEALNQDDDFEDPK